MNEEVKRLGEVFRGKRKELNLSLKEVENSTSIRSTYLEAIEEGKVYDFISAVYAAGFIKQYASFLGMDSDRLVREHPLAFKGALERQEFDYGIGTLEHRGSMGGGVRWLPNVVWAVAALGVLLIAWYIAKLLGVL